MGIYLKGPLLKRVQSAELLSTAVCPGTIQVNGDGEMILLMTDCQTTGGYPRIAQVAYVDLPICAQLKPGDEILFEEISPLAAEKLYFKQERDLAKLALAIQTK
jgi:antagonist of KipI